MLYLVLAAYVYYYCVKPTVLYESSVEVYNEDAAVAAAAMAAAAAMESRGSISALFPGKVNDQRRLLDQLDFGVADGQKVIQVMDTSDSTPEGSDIFRRLSCPVQNCRLQHINIARVEPQVDAAVVKDDDSDAVLGEPRAVDALLYMNYVPSSLTWLSEQRQRGRSVHRVTVLYLLESPEHTADLSHLGGSLNWTATYRGDSVLPTPYGMYRPMRQPPPPPPPRRASRRTASRNYAAGRTKLVAWMTSNCYTPNKRELYVAELRKYVRVDVYGQCGEYKCKRKEMDNCLSRLSKHYKFYLAFENSNCHDYITEKFFRNALR